MVGSNSKFLIYGLLLAILQGIPNAHGQENAIKENGLDNQTKFYKDKIRPLLNEHCVRCHGSEEQGGGLKLDTLEAMLHGGDSGQVLKVGEPSNSLLWKRISSVNPDERMPPEGDGLSTSQIESMSQWIAQGAHGVDEPTQQDKSWQERLEHWAWKPMRSEPIPSRLESKENLASPIDGWIDVKLSQKQLPWSPPADRPTWLRRVYFDLIGLPPTPEELAAFVADDDPNAKGKVVDRLLANPRYGERWARHWLDVVHYGDTHGYDKDKPRPNAWPYRDYVIRALNEDRPYSQFIQQQIAGDTLPIDPSRGLSSADNNEALGFISAGPWDAIGHTEVPETKTDGKIARHLDRDNMVATAIGTFSSITIQCAQCHNHKFDPFTQKDYYALQAVFAAVDRSERSYYADAQIESEANTIQRELAAVVEAFKQYQTEVRQATGEQLEPIEKSILELTMPLKSQLPVEYGYHSQISTQAKTSKWVQVDLGEAIPIESVRVHPCYDDFNSIGPGFGFPIRWQIRGSSSPDFQNAVQLANYTSADFRNPSWCPVEVDCKSLPAQQRTVRYIRMDAEVLVERSRDYIFALAELEIFNAAGDNVALNKTVTSLDSIEAGPRWGAKNLVDGKTPTGKIASELVVLHQAKMDCIERSIPPTLRAQGLTLESKERQLRGQLASLPQPQRVFAGTVHNGSGAFRGTGPEGGKPRPIYLLARGNVTQPGRVVMPSALPGQFGLPDFFQLPENHSESERRAALAKWLIHPDHPLTWRSLVNRLWQYHFGRGIVDTPNDFGRMGGVPSHPELLDYLAMEFRDSQSIKNMHRKMILTTVYGQSSVVHDPAAMAIDSENVFLWRQSRRKLEAEAVRDAALASSGSLDLKMGGPGYQDFVIERPEHSPHYEYDLADPADPKTFRRSVYRFIVRSQLQPFMTLLDCADPSLRVDRRNETVSATQALTMLNNGFMLEQAQRFADRLQYEFPQSDPELMVARAFELALSRKPSEAEAKIVREYSEKHGWENTCRLLFNLNEFSFVD